MGGYTREKTSLPRDRGFFALPPAALADIPERVSEGSGAWSFKARSVDELRFPMRSFAFFVRISEPMR